MAEEKKLTEEEIADVNGGQIGALLGWADSAGHLNLLDKPDGTEAQAGVQNFPIDTQKSF